MTLVPVTTAEPILPLDDIKAHLRITQDDLDPVLIGLNEAAADWLETYTGRPPRTRVYDLVLDAFPCFEIELPRLPVTGITAASFTYVDSGGTVTQVPSSVYTTDFESTPARVHLAYSQSWPFTRCQPRAVRLRFTCGYANMDSLPEPLRQAMLFWLQAHLDGDTDQKLMSVAQTLAWPYRLFQ